MRKYLQKVSFQVQRSPQKYKDPNKIISFKAKNFCKLYTLSTLVVYTFTFTYSLASRVFPKAKYSVICREFPMGSQFHFSQ